MSKVLILEFDGTPDQYEAVNKSLGIDQETHEGDWPAPLQTHIGAFSPEAGLVVVEVWESEEAQAEFMGRLAPALAEAGMPEPTRMQWLELLGIHHL